MLVRIVVAEVIVILIAGWRLTRLVQPEREQAIVETAAAVAELEVQSAYDCGASRRLLRREHAAVLGSAIIWMVALPYLVWSSSETSSQPSWFPISFVVMIVIGITARPLSLAALLCWEVTLRRGLRGPRVARLSTPSIVDYLRPLTVWTTRILLGVIVPVVALFVWKTQSHQANKASLGNTRTVAIVASSLIALATVEVISRRLVALPQPASSPLQLQWDDAIRALQLGELHSAATLFAVLLLTISLDVLYGGGVAGFTLAGAVIVLAVTGDTSARYRQRLWPAPTDGVPA